MKCHIEEKEEAVIKEIWENHVITGKKIRIDSNEFIREFDIFI